MDNENLVLKIKHDNWGEIGPNAWQGTEWKIYGDLKMEVFLTVNFGARWKFLLVASSRTSVLSTPPTT